VFQENIINAETGLANTVGTPYAPRPGPSDDVTLTCRSAPSTPWH